MNVFARSLYLQGLLLMPEENITGALREVVPVRRVLARLAADTGMDMPELCARFPLNNPAITSVLTGVDNAGQLQQSLVLLKKGTLSAKLYQAIKEAVPSFKEKLIRPCLWENN
jgi:aryl-alcohol dehydrogenase-like predicted oxidoreductase